MVQYRSIPVHIQIGTTPQTRTVRVHARLGLFNLKANSPDLTLNGGLYRQQYQDGLRFGIEIILNYPALERRCFAGECCRNNKP